ncbi:MAG: glycosyltransferase family 87 protein [Acidobacteriaceae bacterium]|nr:glycosyltransferase family 87 protein [Acidobacteriaceae bacterium]
MNPVLPGLRDTLWVDFRSYIPKFAYIHSRAFYDGAALTYPATTVVPFAFFLIPYPHGRVQILLACLRLCSVIAAGAFIMLVGFRCGLLRRGMSKPEAVRFLLATLFLSFPFWFLLYTGNFEFTVWFVLVGAFYFFWKGDDPPAAVLFGLAAAMKIFPVILLGLFIARRQLKAVAIAIVTAVAVTVPSLWILCPDIHVSWKLTNDAIGYTRNFYMLTLRPIESGFDHTLFVLIKRLLLPLPPPAQMDKLLHIYLVVVAIGGVLIFIFRIRFLPVINQILCFVVAMITLTPVSYDYTLIHLYIPFALLCFVSLERFEENKRALLIAFSLFAFVLSAQSEFILHGLRFAGQLKALGLLLLFVLALVHPFHSSSNQHLQEHAQ